MWPPIECCHCIRCIKFCLFRIIPKDKSSLVSFSLRLSSMRCRSTLWEYINILCTIKYWNDLFCYLCPSYILKMINSHNICLVTKNTHPDFIHINIFMCWCLYHHKSLKWARRVYHVEMLGMCKRWLSTSTL